MRSAPMRDTSLFEMRLFDIVLGSRLRESYKYILDACALSRMVHSAHWLEGFEIFAYLLLLTLELLIALAVRLPEECEIVMEGSHAFVPGRFRGIRTYQVAG